MTDSEPGGLFSGLFGRGDVAVGDAAWLQAMLDAEAALARALERAGLAPASAGLHVDAGRMAANLDAARGLPMAEHLTAVLAPALGRLAAHNLIARASRRAVETGRALADVLLETPEFAGPVRAAGLTPIQVADALEPSAYLGAAVAFVAAALAAHHQSGGKAR